MGFVKCQGVSAADFRYLGLDFWKDMKRDDQGRLIGCEFGWIDAFLLKLVCVGLIILLEWVQESLQEISVLNAGFSSFGCFWVLRQCCE